VLVGVDDVEACIGEEATDSGDQTRAVRAGEQQPRCRRIRDLPIIPASTRLQLGSDLSRKKRFIVRPREGIPCLTSCQTALTL